MLNGAEALYTPRDIQKKRPAWPPNPNANDCMDPKVQRSLCLISTALRRITFPDTENRAVEFESKENKGMTN